MSFESRDFKGYLQYRELVEEGSPPDLFGHRKMKPSGHWQFEIHGFGDDVCSVYKSDGSKEDVPIDAQNRITICGKKYSHWHH